MTQHHQEPSDDIDIGCHLQQNELGPLICSTAGRVKYSTTETDATVCVDCPAGIVYREVGCDAIFPDIWIFDQKPRGKSFQVNNLHCKRRSRKTTLDYCRTCDLPTAETTQKIISETHGLFKAHGFDSALSELENAKTSYREEAFDDVITASISCFESTMRICLDCLGESLPTSPDVKSLWKSVASVLEFSDLDAFNSTKALLNTLTGVALKLGELRNKLSNAHGKGDYPPDVSAVIAELALNTSLTLSTAIVRRFIQKKSEINIPY